MTNEEQARYWNSDEAAHWLVHEARYEQRLAPYTDQLLTAAAVRRDDRVVDVGCGTGSTSRAAGRVAVDGAVLGVDLSEQMLRQATRRAEQDGLTNVRFDHGDAQVYGFTPDAGDVAMSRFGVMFFADPAAAFANIARGLRPGGRLAFVCWQKALDNEWIMVPGTAAAQHVALPAPEDSTAPGPFSLGERDRILTVLRVAEFGDIAVEPIAVPLWVGTDVADAVAFLRTSRIGKPMFEDVEPETASRVGDAVAAAFESYATPDGVFLGSQAWIVTATRPSR